MYHDLYKIYKIHFIGGGGLNTIAQRSVKNGRRSTVTTCRTLLTDLAGLRQITLTRLFLVSTEPKCMPITARPTLTTP